MIALIIALLFGLSCAVEEGTATGDPERNLNEVGPPGSGLADGGGDAGSSEDLSDGGYWWAGRDGGTSVVRHPDCPLNRGWPCSCESSARSRCDDGSPCVALAGAAAGRGVCLAPCTPNTDDLRLLCPPTDYPAPGWCRISTTAGGSATHCLLTCANPMTVTCPPDQVCHVEGESQGYCVPAS